MSSNSRSIKSTNIDESSFEELKKYIPKASSQWISGLANKFTEHYRSDGTPFMKMRLDAGNKQKMESEISQLIELAEKRKQKLNMLAKPVVSAARKGMMIGPALDRADQRYRESELMKKKREPICSNVHECSQHLRNIAKQLAQQFNMDDLEEGANILLEGALRNPTGALKRKPKSKKKPKKKGKKKNSKNITKRRKKTSNR
jgi:hypothetical protein